MSGVVERLSLELQGGDGIAALALAACAVVVLVVLGVRATHGAPARRRGVLVALRVAAALAIVLLALQPALRRESVAVSSAPVAVIVDASGSMAVRESQGAGPGRPRIERAGAWLASHREEIDALAATASVEWYAAADGGLRPVSRQEAEAGTLEPRGDTDLAGSLKALAERHPGRERPAVLLLSDGADHGAIGKAVTDGGDVAALVPRGGPIVGVAPGAAGLADRSVEVIARDPVGFLRTEVTVRVRVRSTGLSAEDVPVTLAQAGQVVQVRTVHVGGAAGDAAETTLRLKASKVGESLFTVSVPVAAGEAIPGNNEQAFSVRIVRDRIRVLQIVGRPSWDGRYLRELLKRDPAIDLISFFILRTQWDDPAADVEELSLIPFPIRELFDEKLESFDLLVFQNFSFAAHGIDPYLDVVARHVRDDGAGMLVIGGDLTLGRDWAGPDLGPIMPVEVRSPKFVPGAVGIAMTDVGARHPVLRFPGEGADVASLIGQLLPATGVNAGIEPKPDAQVLLRTKDAEARPLLVAGEAGEGRVLVLATDGSWRWSLPMAEKPGGARTYESFYQSALRWLVKDERSALVMLEADRRSVAPGEATEVRAWVRGEAYEPRRGETVKLTVKDAAGQVVVEKELKTGEDGAARLTFEAPRPGPYGFTASTGRGSAGPLFVECVDRSREMSEPAARPQVLQALAEATDGSVMQLDDPRGRIPLAGRREERVESVSLSPLWRTWWAWGVVAGLLCCEWWLRRRWGLA